MARVEPVQRSDEDRALFVPDDLLVMYESDAQQPREHVAGDLRCVPDVGCLQAGDELERLRPIGSRVARDGGFGVSLSSVLHVRRLGRTVSV
jgi:hypothetical protein